MKLLSDDCAMESYGTMRVMNRKHLRNSNVVRLNVRRVVPSSRRGSRLDALAVGLLRRAVVQMEAMVSRSTLRSDGAYSGVTRRCAVRSAELRGPQYVASAGKFRLRPDCLRAVRHMP